MPYSYAGVGARTTPPEIQEQMEILGKALAIHGWILRSGGADGADMSFEVGCDRAEGPKEIYLPWKGFNGNSSERFVIPELAVELAFEHHPNPGWLRTTKHVQKLMARNVMQVLGEDLFSPSSMVVCWTLDGCEDGSRTTKKTGGTGQAIRLAKAYDIPVFNLKNDTAFDRVVDFVGSLSDHKGA